MVFSSQHRIRFEDTDAAGVMYFAQGLALCHRAYEESLLAAGVDLAAFFSPGAPLAYPIVHTQMTYRLPLRCGDCVTLTLASTRRSESSFEIAYQVHLSDRPDQRAAAALTRHLCISPQSRDRQPLPPTMETWLQMTASDGGLARD